MSLSDYIQSYLDPMPMHRRILLAKQALNKTYFGQKGLIQPIEVDGKLMFQATYFDPLRQKGGEPARMVTADLNKAMEYLSGEDISQIANFEPGSLGPAEHRGYGQVLMDINESMQLTGDQQYGGQIVIHKGKPGSKSTKEFLAKRAKEKDGIVFPTKDGGIALRMIQGDRVLSMEETLEVMSKSGKPLFTTEELDKALKEGNKGLSELFAKLPKRLKGILSPREISISGGLMEKLLGSATGVGSEQLMKELIAATLNVDTVFETIALAHGKNTAKNFVEGTKQFNVAAYIEESFQYEGGGTASQEAKGFVDEVLDEIIASKNLGSKSAEIKTTLSNLVTEVINNGGIDAAEGKYGIDEIKKLLKVPGVYDDETKDVLTGLLKELEKGRDGSSLVNVKYAKTMRDALQAELKSLTLNRDEASIIRKTELGRQIKELTFKNSEEAIGLSQVTIRGSVRIGGLNLFYKTAAQFKKFTDRFEKYAIITAISGLKAETGIGAGTPILNFSGLGESTSRVYADPMLVAFNDALFGNAEDVATSQNYAKSIQKEFQETLSRGYLQEGSEVLEAIKKGAELDPSKFLEQQQFSKMLSKDFQQRILNLHNSGVSINDSPEYMNLLAKWYQSELYKTKNGQLLPVAADVYRYAINSEANSMTGTTGRKILLRQQLDVKIGEGADIISARIAQFRVSNHNILFNEGDIRKFYHALGGFDLDDKGLPILGTYMSGGKRRLAAAMVRQPTAMGEVIGLTTFNDIESYREIFGGNRHFMTMLGEMAEEDSRYKLLSTSLQGINPLTHGMPMSDDSFNKNMMDRLEQLTIDVNDRLMGATFDDKGIRTGGMRDYNRNFFEKLGVLKSGENRIENFSATKLIALGNEDPVYISLGFQALISEVEQMTLEGDILENVDSMISPKQKAELTQIVKKIETQRKNLSNLGAKDLDDAVDPLSKEFYDKIEKLGLSGDQLQVAMGKTFLQKSTSLAVDNMNILGVFTNRATVVGHGLRQIEELLKGIPGVEQDLINRKLMIGFPGAEKVIDMTQTITSGNMVVDRMMLESTAKIGQLGDETTRKVLKAIYGEKTDLDKLGRTTINQFGKMFGYLRQKHKLDGTDPNKALILDEGFLTNKKMQDPDLIDFAKSLSEGMIEADADADVANINKAVESGQAEQVKEVLRARGIIAKGSLSNVVDIAENSRRQIDAMKKRYSNAQISKEQQLASRITKESRVASEKILDKNAPLIKFVQDLNTLVQDGSASDAISIELEFRKMDLADNLLTGVQEVQKSMGISGYELMSGIQYSGIQRGLGEDFFTKLPDSSMKPDETSANLFYRYMAMSKQKAIYEDQTRNLKLREYIDNLFANMSDTQKISAITPGLDLEFADDFFEKGRSSSAISSIIKGEVRGTPEEERIGRALKAKIIFENAEQLDGDASGFLNGKLASGNILTSVDDITDQTPSIVADTLRDLAAPVKGKATKTVYTKMSKQYLAEQFGKSNVRKVAIGAGLAIAASFIYQRKKDHTQEDISGPPLLPGGSAYESDYPKRSPEIPQVRGQGYTAGMNYRVSLLGDKSQVERFSAAASGLTNGNINSTMYNRIPDMARDPYQSMARSY